MDPAHRPDGRQDIPRNKGSLQDFLFLLSAIIGVSGLVISIVIIMLLASA